MSKKEALLAKLRNRLQQEIYVSTHTGLQSAIEEYTHRIACTLSAIERVAKLRWYTKYLRKWFLTESTWYTRNHAIMMAAEVTKGLVAIR